ncbi:MAG TPA: hypothetical protein VHY35_24890 [Stellaceae bacterium]|jgi:hypothetical protein|nr:hypothetical protein [Stellaceae bacterium]
MAKTGSISNATLNPNTGSIDGAKTPRPAMGISPATIAELRRNPRFFEARQSAGLQIVSDHTGSRLLNSVVNDRGRFMIVMFAQYLHHAVLPGESEAGLTVGRLRRLCAETGIASPGRATAMLNLMRFAGYVRVASGNGDRRRRVLVPAERLLALQRRRWSRHLTALSLVMPEGSEGLRFFCEPWFESGLVRNMVGEFIRGFRFADFVPELAPYFERNGALITLLQLAMIADRDVSDAAPLTISRLASQFGIARTQVRNILDDAENGGLIERTGIAGAPIVALPRLADAIDRFLATSFFYTAHSVRLAIDERDQIKTAEPTFPSVEYHGPKPRMPLAGDVVG